MLFCPHLKFVILFYRLKLKKTITEDIYNSAAAVVTNVYSF